MTMASGPCRSVLFGAVAASLLAGVAPSRASGDEGRGASLYDRGELTSGAAVQATVAGDVAIAGKAAACATCHGRSGLGSTEGREWVPPVAGRILFSSRGSGRRERPGYDRESLARALRDGIDAAGQPLDSLMPRYRIGDGDVDALASHLRSLAPDAPPGVSSHEIRFAVVATPDADPGVKKATWEVLSAFAANKNVQTRGFVPWDRNFGSFRRWVLVPWDLQGAPEGWGRQLEDLYRAEPVFALLSGVGGSEWGPVHDFCERRRVPAFLPNVDVPPLVAASGSYSVYFSLGVSLEAAAVAAELSGDVDPLTVVQFVADDSRARAAAAALRAVLPRSATFLQIDVAQRAAPGGDRMNQALGRAAPVLSKAKRERRAAVLWLGADEMGKALAAVAGEGEWERVFISSTLSQGDARGPPLPEGLDPAVVQVVHPYSEPSEIARRLPRILAWLRSRGLPEDELRVRDQTLTACMVVGDALMHALTQIDREYVLELLDHGGNSPSLSAFHSRLAFGPGQRLLERSVFLVALGAGAAPPRRIVP